MALVRHRGFDHVATQHLIQLRAVIDMDLVLFAVVILDEILLSLTIHQRSLTISFVRHSLMVGRIWDTDLERS